MTSAPSDAETSLTSPDPESQEIVANPARYYRWTRYLISIGLLMGYGSLYFRDGFITWPQERQRALELESHGGRAEVKPRTELDINLNRAIGLTIPPLGLALLIWTLYNSRGQYRLSGHTLHVPGHPPVPLEAIRQIDKTLWDKKGIAYIDYELPESAPATLRLKLDDFVYEQEKTDAILERIEQIIAPAAPPEEADQPLEGIEAGGEDAVEHE